MLTIANILGVTACVAVALACLIIIAGVILEVLGFYEKMEQRDGRPHDDNDEYDYGHNVNHEPEEL